MLSNCYIKVARTPVDEKQFESSLVRWSKAPLFTEHRFGLPHSYAFAWLRKNYAKWMCGICVDVVLMGSYSAINRAAGRQLLLVLFNVAVSCGYVIC